MARGTARAGSSAIGSTGTKPSRVAFAAPSLKASVAVNQALNQLRSANQQEREAVRARLLTLLGQDFSQDEATLGIVLPPSFAVRYFSAGSSASTRFAGRSTAREE
jgi:hypothetical protein